MLVPLLSELVAGYPLDERLRECHLLALYRCGRVSDALAAFADAEAVLSAELDVGPGPGLRSVATTIRRSIAPQAAARGPDPVHQLPVTTSTFTGRAAESAWLRDLLAPQHTGVPVVVVAGPAGVGKSALAVRVAHQLADRFPDGQLYLDLHGSTAGVSPMPAFDVLCRLLRSLDTEGRTMPGDLVEAVAAYRNRVAGHRLLLVLDNAADAGQVGPLLPGAGGCAVVVTCRRPLADLDVATHLHLGLLPTTEAVELFVRVAGAHRVGGKVGDIETIVASCDGLPLAIRIAGARLATHPSWTVRTLGERLTDQRRRLDEFRVGDTAIRTALLVSYRGLRGPEAARAFHLLGALDCPDVRTPVVAALLGNEREAEAATEELLDAQLLAEPAPGVYRMHDLVRLFARECAAETEPAATWESAVSRVMGHYLSTTRRACLLLQPGDHKRNAAPDPDAGERLDDRAQALQWLQTEWERMLAVARQAAAGGDELARGVVELTEPLFWFFRARPLTGPWLEFIAVALAVAQRLGDEVALARVEGDLGAAYLREYRLAEAEEPFQRSLTRRRALGDAAGEATILNNLGVLHGEGGDFQSAIAYTDESLAIRRRIDDQHGVASCLVNLGALHSETGRLDRSIEYSEQALDLCRRLDDRDNQARILINLATSYLQQGRHGAAADALEHALAISRELGDDHGVASALVTLAKARCDAGRPDLGLRDAEESLALCRVIGYRWGEATALRGTAAALAALGDTAAARECLHQALTIFTNLDAADAQPVRDMLDGLPEAGTGPAGTTPPDPH